MSSPPDNELSDHTISEPDLILDAAPPSPQPLIAPFANSHHAPSTPRPPNPVNKPPPMIPEPTPPTSPPPKPPRRVLVSVSSPSGEHLHLDMEVDVEVDVDLDLDLPASHFPLISVTSPHTQLVDAAPLQSVQILQPVAVNHASAVHVFDTRSILQTSAVPTSPMITHVSVSPPHTAQLPHRSSSPPTSPLSKPSDQRKVSAPSQSANHLARPLTPPASKHIPAVAHLHAPPKHQVASLFSPLKEKLQLLSKTPPSPDGVDETLLKDESPPLSNRSSSPHEIDKASPKPEKSPLLSKPFPSLEEMDQKLTKSHSLSSPSISATQSPSQEALDTAPRKSTVSFTPSSSDEPHEMSNSPSAVTDGNRERSVGSDEGSQNLTDSPPQQQARKQQPTPSLSQQTTQPQDSESADEKRTTKHSRKRQRSPSPTHHSIISSDSPEKLEQSIQPTAFIINPPSNAETPDVEITANQSTPTHRDSQSNRVPASRLTVQEDCQNFDDKLPTSNSNVENDNVNLPIHDQAEQSGPQKPDNTSHHEIASKPSQQLDLISPQSKTEPKISADIHSHSDQSQQAPLETKAIPDRESMKEQSQVALPSSQNNSPDAEHTSSHESPAANQQIQHAVQDSVPSRKLPFKQPVCPDDTPPVSPIQPILRRRVRRNVDELDARQNKESAEILDNVKMGALQRAPSPQHLEGEACVPDEQSKEGHIKERPNPSREHPSHSLSPEQPASPIYTSAAHDPRGPKLEGEPYNPGSPQSPVYHPTFPIDEELPQYPISYDGPPSPGAAPSKPSSSPVSPNQEEPSQYHAESPKAEEPPLHSADAPKVEKPSIDTSKLCPILEHSLARLPLQNVSVSVPNSATYSPASADDIAVVHAMEDILEAEKQRRTTDTFAMSKPLKSILIIAKDPERAYAWAGVLSECSSLSHATHGIHNGERGSARVERHRRHDSEALDSIFAVKNAVITLSETAIRDAERNHLHLRRICLIVFDTADYIVSRGHPCSRLMRDFYLALPILHRPRVLAICSRVLRDTQKPPIERHLFSPFVSEGTENDSCWKSCYGTGTRAPDSGIDMEYISYSPSLFGDSETINGYRHDSRASTELEFLLAEVGPLGAALYQQRRKYRRLENGSEFQRSYDASGSLYRFGEKACLRGLTPKCLSLLNELERGYAASTTNDQFRVVILAGRPAIAAALGEVISSLPVFEAVTTRIVIGCDGAKSFESYDKDDDGERCRWQGYDTDDDSVAFFQAGEANILIVASPLDGVRKWIRMLPNCPLIVRYDESSHEATAELENGRCRVIAFRKRRKRLSRSSVRKGENGDTANNAEPVVEEPQFLSSHEPQVPVEPSDVNVGGVPTKLDTGRDDPAITLEVIPNKRPKRKSHASDDEQEPDSVYYCKPPAYLIGPDKEGSGSCFTYRMFLYGSDPRQHSSESKDSAIFLGLEDFVLVLSRKLQDEDKIMSFQDMFPSRTAVTAFLKLEYQGCISMTPQEVQLARQYTAALFCLTFPSLNPSRFFWEDVPAAAEGNSSSSDIAANEATDLCYLRKYLLLPSSKAESSDEPNSKSSTAEDAAEPLKPLQKYFSSDRRIPQGKLPGQKCTIDWDAVRKVLELQDPDRFYKEAKSKSSVEPNRFQELEASFVFSTFPGEKAMVCGHLKYDLSPLSSQIRSKKFELTEDGMFIPNDELSNLTELHVRKESLNVKSYLNSSSDQAENAGDKLGANASKLSGKKRLKSRKEIDSTSKIIAARWCKESSRLVPDKRIVGWKKKRATVSKPKKATFDPTRNIFKQRKHWVGRLAYTLEHNLSLYNSRPLKYLDQPLISGTGSRHCGVQELMGIVAGSSLQDVCDKVVSKSDETRLLAPEVCKSFPMSIGAVFLPVVLSGVERHLSICELRQALDCDLEVEADTKVLMQAVTAAHVNPSANYERLELLGDSVLKLTCTLRLFTSRPHDSEGQMHVARAYKVCNARLHRLAYKKGLHNYIRFREESLNDWKPPGTDTRGKEQRVSLKGLADVAEAICGAYFLFGSYAADAKAEKEEVLSVSSEDGYRVDCESGSSDSEGEGRKKRAKKQRISRNCKRRVERRRANYNPMSVENVARGYAAGCKLLEECNVFDEAEPTHREVLLSAIHAMHPKGSAVPSEISLEAFPYDARVSHPEKPWEEHFGVLEGIIGYKFKRRPLLVCALTHGSYVKGNGSCTAEEQTFQRLEFLGDAAADFFVVRYLYDTYPGLGPGEMTALKGNVVSNESFARVTVKHGIHKYLYHNSTAFSAEISCFVENVKAEQENDGMGTKKGALGELAAPKVLGDIFEAIVGAVLVDSGLQEVWKVCTKLLSESLRENADPMRDDVHPSILLQDLVMRVWKISSSPPHYSLENKRFDNGQKRTEATVLILGEKIASGRGSTSKRAKLQAAVAALRLLRDPDSSSHGAQLLKRLREEGVRRMVAAQRGVALTESHGKK